jgi:hypothetical protein
MSNNMGYGRGYYGDAQLENRQEQKRGGGWFKVVLAVGAGAALWYFWPRKKVVVEYVPVGSPAIAPPQYVPTLAPQYIPTLAPPATAPGPDVLVEAPPVPTAPVLGFPSQQAYEDAVVASAKQLQEAGATIQLAPHLQHLMTRLEPPKT